ncbi:hypothetical protein CQW39_29025 [Streptomyces griseofuscus]|uniref:Uncharacterized protein n=1 Tax=Streptomyces griseofuscus TaxID=146922 RepID=A0A3R8Q6T5_9ACTN|nr:hypothetical protein CQW39_29025 [Streptomyces griseofuscus]RRQ79784.1 hypothetical protein CQW44_33965 [Streptomyces griseofuscus]
MPGSLRLATVFQAYALPLSATRILSPVLSAAAVTARSLLVFQPVPSFLSGSAIRPVGPGLPWLCSLLEGGAAKAVVVCMRVPVSAVQVTRAAQRARIRFLGLKRGSSRFSLRFPCPCGHESARLRP